jgi:uncharacterized membrane protein YfcA
LSTPSNMAMPSHSIGYVYWPALLGLVLPCILLVPVGVRLAMRLEVKFIRRIFAALLFLIGSDMIYEASMTLRPFFARIL